MRLNGNAHFQSPEAEIKDWDVERLDISTGNSDWISTSLDLSY
jgi:hypothetical protein